MAGGICINQIEQSQDGIDGSAGGLHIDALYLLQAEMGTGSRVKR